MNTIEYARRPREYVFRIGPRSWKTLWRRAVSHEKVADFFISSHPHEWQRARHTGDYEAVEAYPLYLRFRGNTTYILYHDSQPIAEVEIAPDWSHRSIQTWLT